MSEHVLDLLIFHCRDNGIRIHFNFMLLKAQQITLPSDSHYPGCSIIDVCMCVVPDFSSKKRTFVVEWIPSHQPVSLKKKNIDYTFLLQQSNNRLSF